MRYDWRNNWVLFVHNLDAKYGNRAGASRKKERRKLIAKGASFRRCSDDGHRRIVTYSVPN
jgi:hypothetical protein